MVSSSSGGRTLLYAEVTTDDAEIVWSKDGKNLSGSRFKLMQGGSILIDPTYPDDSGRYIITASNSHGTTDEAVMLKVVQTSPPEGTYGRVLQLKFTTENQGLTKDQEEDKTLKVPDEGWNSQKQLSGPVEEKIIVSSSKALTGFIYYYL